MNDNENSITTKITKIGNSKGIIVPRQVIKSLSLEEGDSVEMYYHEDTQELVISFPSTKQLKLSNT
ncbi:MAG: AbrB/MazE/SpoVT family DNA-binding domain-containing protein [Candidatus Moraniibacteriota bacterium]|nr:MAG: AbrB/MazE/SpoVT family DNA-binding domain-containing protein [Candidatus Moranbacteria bacterium]